jgi:hypothetical protein
LPKGNGEAQEEQKSNRFAHVERETSPTSTVNASLPKFSSGPEAVRA